MSSKFQKHRMLISNEHYNQHNGIAKWILLMNEHNIWMLLKPSGCRNIFIWQYYCMLSIYAELLIYAISLCQSFSCLQLCVTVWIQMNHPSLSSTAFLSSSASMFIIFKMLSTSCPLPTFFSSLQQWLLMTFPESRIISPCDWSILVFVLEPVLPGCFFVFI